MFKLLEDITKVELHPVRLNAATRLLTNPNNANPLEIGEWLELETGITSELWQRSTGALPSRCWYLERGRTEPQILGKGSVLEAGGWEADTKIFNPAGLTIGAPLKVGNVTVAALTKSGVLLHTMGAATEWVVGYVTRLHAYNNDYLRLHAVSPSRTA